MNTDFPKAKGIRYIKNENNEIAELRFTINDNTELWQKFKKLLHEQEDTQREKEKAIIAAKIKNLEEKIELSRLIKELEDIEKDISDGI